MAGLRLAYLAIADGCGFRMMVCATALMVRRERRNTCIAQPFIVQQITVNTVQYFIRGLEPGLGRAYACRCFAGEHLAGRRLVAEPVRTISNLMRDQGSILSLSCSCACDANEAHHGKC